MRKPMVKAMACALAFTMVATTPLTASAFDLASIFSVSKDDNTATGTGTGTGTNTDTDGLDENVKKVEKEVEGGNPVVKIERDEKIGDYSIGTTTITTTNTNGLESFEGGQDDEKYIIGVTFDEDVVNIEVGQETELVATVLFNDGTTFKYNAEKGNTDASLKDLLVFRKIRTADKDQDLGAGSVSYVYDESSGGMDIVKRDTLKVRGIHGGSFYIQAALKTDKSGEYKYFDVVAVNVKEYATDISIGELPALYTKHVYNLDNYLTRVSGTSNDKITWSAYEINSKNGAEKSTKTVKITADGFMTVNKEIGKDTVYVRAVSEKGIVAEKAIEATKGNPITKLDYTDKANEKSMTLGWGYIYNKSKKTSVDLVKEKTVTVVATAQDNSKATTDDIEWTSKNENVATVVKSDDDKTATIVATGVGKTTITAKATSGKKITYSVTVKAPLESLSISDEAGNKSGEIYVGQSIQLVANGEPGKSTDKVTWEVVKDPNTGVKNAKVDKNGKVTALVTKDTKKADAEVTIKASFKHQKDGKKDATNVYTLKVLKSDIDANKLTLIDQYRLADDGKTVVYKDGAITKDKLYVGKDDTYSALRVAKTSKSDKTGTDITAAEMGTVANMLTWSSSKTKVARVNAGQAVVDAAGKTNITASFVNKDGKTVKAVVAVTAPQAVTKLQLKQTELSVAASATKDTKVTVKVSKQLPKNATKEKITWSIETADENASYFSFYKDVNTGNSAKVVVSKDAPAGTTAKVRATAANGATTTATITVVNKTTKVAFVKDTTAAIAGTNKVSKMTMTVNKADERFDLDDYIAVVSEKGVNAENNEKVTYSVSKSGIVTIGRDNTVYAVKAGTVKITAKTPSGKKAVLTVKVVNPTH